MSNQADLIVKDLHVVVEENEILKGLNLTVPQGEIHALMGPNGSGKSTLAYTLMGHPNYTVTGGEVIFKGQNVLDLASEDRARLGLFLAFQYPTAITGVTMFQLPAVGGEGDSRRLYYAHPVPQTGAREDGAFENGRLVHEALSE